MTWPGAALYLSWIGLMIAYLMTRNSGVFAASMVLFVAVLVWRLKPQRSRSCDVSEPAASTHKNATD